MEKTFSKPLEIDSEIVEWIDGERITLQEYEARLSNQISKNAAVYLRNLTQELNWIFGLPM